MRLNRIEKTVVIPAKFEANGFQYFYGGPLPELRNGTTFDIVVPEYAIVDRAFLNKLETEDDKELIPEGSKIYAAVSSANVPQNLRDSATTLTDLFEVNIDPITASLFGDSLFVDIILEEPLFLQMRGTKLGRLRPVRCNIPQLNLKATSLNHAYRVISELFEPQRISHAGNVFQKMLFIDSNKKFHLLGDMRGELEASNEQNLR